MGILFFTGWGVVTNADHLPFDLNIGDIFKNNPGNNAGTTENNQQNTNPLNTQESANDDGNSNQKSDESKEAKSDSKDKSESKENEISSSQAKSIAQKYIEEPGTNAGKPEKVNIGGKKTYVVPVESEGKTVGEIHVDPETGENVGGAGGAP
ncbi:PepSY domain-containing protein [Methanobacterium sp. ACI-7]|uniref:PepSY domain-containing protein n=1 Tax=unclassified Methanobacterium TaxID=2627676 RepID=UPI0039C00FCE